ncbi:hypothetical protein Hanom_Chr08g00705381 [Helianthus anomalus]
MTNIEHANVFHYLTCTVDPIKIIPNSNTPCRSNATLSANSICPDCGSSMNVMMTVVTPNEIAETKEAKKKRKGWYVKKVVTYMVMDDLVGLKLLEASLKTKKVLTTIFMH